MAIIGVRRLRESGTETGEGGLQSFRTIYVVKSTSPTENRSAILNCGLLPVYGSYHPENPAAICTEVRAYQVPAKPTLWRVECYWSVQTARRRSPTEDQKSPELREPKWRMEFVSIPQFWFHDLNGKPFSDTAGTPFSPPPEIPIFVDQVTVSRYESEIDRAQDRVYLNATNSDTWNGAEPGTALISNIATERVFEWGRYWFARTYTILVSPKIRIPEKFAHTTDEKPVYRGGWDSVYVLNAGSRAKYFVNGKRVVRPIKMDGIADGQPQPLNADGIVLLRDENGDFGPRRYYCEFRIVDRVSFAPLNLVPPWL